MPFQIRNKETKEIVSVQSGKSVWTTAGHAKAAFKTSGLSRWGTGKGTYEYHGIPKGVRFDDQDKLEIIEVTPQGDTGQLKQAIKLLAKVKDNYPCMDDSDYELMLEIEKFLKENV
jgi:hypothetical protein